MKKKYLVIGAGEVGPAICHRLLMHQDTGKVTIADKDPRRAQAAVVLHLKSLGRPINNYEFARLDSDNLDITDRSNDWLLSEFSGFDCVISAIPATYSPRIAMLASRARTHFCELGGVTRVTEAMRGDRSLINAAIGNGVSVIHDCGFAPGLSGQMAQVLVRRADIAPQSVIVYVGGLPQLPDALSFNWQRTFSGIGMAELLEPSTILRKGALETALPCSEGTRIALPSLLKTDPGIHLPFGDLVSRITAGAGVMPAVMQRLGVLNSWEETLRWDWDAFLAFIDEIPKEHRARAIEERLPMTSREHPDIAVMYVVAQSERTASHYELCTLYDAHLGISAMAKVTGYAAADTARLAALGRTPAGVMAPEELNWQTNAELIDGLSTELGITLRG